MDKTAIRFALDAYTRGWHIFPCEPGEKEPALLYPGTNKPWRIKWYDVATNDVHKIVRWWSTTPYNIGVSAKKSGLLIVDCDIPKSWDQPYDGWDQFKELCERRGVSWEDAIDTYQVETPSKGVHLYYWWPPDVQASQGGLASLVDVRTNGGEKGGYVLGAGSRTSAGWYHVINPAPIQPCPTWLVDEVKAKPAYRPAAEGFTRPHTINTTGLHEYVKLAPEGRRNDSLFWAAAQAAEENSRLILDDLVDMFVEDALEAGLTMSEIRGTVTSAFRKVRNR
jgi:hypothetical protein